MISVYKKYIYSKYLFNFLKVSSVFFIIIMIMNLFEEIKFLQDSDNLFLLPFFLTLLNAPSVFFEILPFIILISAIFFFIEIIESNESIYSSLSLFLIIDQKIIVDKKEISVLFDHLLKNKNLPKEIRYLLIYKKALFQSSFVDESEFLETTKPLINSENKWKPHALLLLGDYFISKKEYIKSIEFYQEIFKIKNLNQSLYDHARTQLTIISND